MPKKPFIKKKDATTYHLIHQSVRDEGTDNPHKMFLHEVAPANVVKDKKDDTRSQYSFRSKQSARSIRSTPAGVRDDASVGTSIVSMGKFRQDDFAYGEYGFEDDGYDYTQHFQPRGTGRFIPAIPLPPAALGALPGTAPPGVLTKETLSSLLDEKKVNLPTELFGGQTFSAQAQFDFDGEEDLPPGLVPPEIDALLEEENDPAKEDEIEDDFVLLADGGGHDEFDDPEYDEEYDEDEVGDDMPELEAPHGGRHLGADGKLRDADGNELSDDGEAMEPVALPALATRPANSKTRAGRRRAPVPLPTEPVKPTMLDKRFEAVAKLYDDDEIGELEEDERTRGVGDISEFESVLDEFLTSKANERVRVGAQKSAEKAEEKAEEEGDDDAEDDEDGDEFDDLDEAGEDDGDEADEDEVAARSAKPRPPAPKPSAKPLLAAPVAPKPTPVPASATAPTAAVSAKKEAQGKTAAVIAPQAKQPTASNGKNHEEVEEEEEEDEEEEEEEEEEYEVIELRERADWDCASIVSTYSNTENHPSLIAEPGKPRIQLSKKTGMPLGVLPVKHKKEAAPVEPRDNLGAPRKKGETPEEKKARKAAIKEARKSARERSKKLGGAFKDEERTQLNATRGQPMGRSVIRMD